MGHWMFNCREVSRMVSKSMDTRLPLMQRIFIRMHLVMCRYCARIRKQLLLIRQMVHLDPDPGPVVEPLGSSQFLSDVARDRMRRLLRQASRKA